MARYPVFEDYKSTGNFNDGIIRCDELLSRKPNDHQLLTTKYQLLVANGQREDAHTILEKLASLPTIADITELITIEQAVIESQEHDYPIPDTAGPLVSKLWSNALKSTIAIPAKLEVLSIRWERAVFDNRIRDMQETLIQFKQVFPKDRKYYMAHAAVTQMCSKSHEDVMARMALMLARKAVSEKFEEDSTLDCRVPGQIFALQKSKQDLESIKGRSSFCGSQQVWKAMREDGVKTTNGTEKTPTTNVLKPSAVPTNEWLAAEIASLKHDFESLIANEETPNMLWTFACACIRLFRYSLNSLREGARRLPAEACFLSISALVRIWELTNHGQWLLHAAFLAETLLKHSEHIHEARLILIYLYMRNGLGSLAIKYFESLKVKEIQHDTIGHVLFTRLGYFHPHSTLLAKAEALDPSKRLRLALDTYIRCEERLADTEASVLNHGQSGMLFDLHELRDTLRQSFSRRVMILEQRRILRLMKNTSDWHGAMVYMGPMEVANWLNYKDTRDLNAAWNYGYDVETALYSTRLNGLPSDFYILTALVSDTVWCICNNVRPPVKCVGDLLANYSTRLQTILDENDSPSPVPQGLELSEHLAGYLAFASLYLRYAYDDITGEQNFPADTISDMIAKVELAIDRLDVPDLVQQDDRYLTEDLLTHYAYADALRNVLAVCRWIRTHAKAHADIEALEKKAREVLDAVKAHAEKCRRQVPKVRALVDTDPTVAAELVKFEGGEAGLMAFYEGVAEAAVEGWDGVGRIKGI